MSASYWESQSRYLDEYLGYFQNDKDIERLKRLLKTLKYKEEFLNDLIADAEKQLLNEKGMCKEYMKTTKYHAN